MATAGPRRAAEHRDASRAAGAPSAAAEGPRGGNAAGVEKNGILLEVHNTRGRVGYGIEASNERTPRAWPAFATGDGVTGFPPTVINVNECDPLRDEGINFYR